MLIRILTFFALFIINSMMIAQADLIWNNGYNKNTTLGHAASGRYQLADNFSLDGFVSISGIEFDAGFGRSLDEYDIVIKIGTSAFSDDVYTETFDLMDSSSFNSVLNYGDSGNFNWTLTLEFLTPQILSAGDYWVTFYADAIGSMSFNDSDIDGDNSALNYYTSSFEYLSRSSERNIDLPFRLIGETTQAIPEPSSLVLVFIGFIGLLGLRKNI